MPIPQAMSDGVKIPGQAWDGSLLAVVQEELRGRRTVQAVAAALDCPQN